MSTLKLCKGHPNYKNDLIPEPILFHGVETVDRKLSFLYSDGGMLHFMDEEFVEFEIAADKVLGSNAKTAMKYLKADEVYRVTFDETNDDPLSLSLPVQVVFAIKETSSAAGSAANQGDKGNVVYKMAELEGGLLVNVPDFCNVGDKIIVDVASSTYIGRSK